MSGEMHATVHNGAIEHGFALHFTLSGKYPDSRVHKVFAKYLEDKKVAWIVPRRHTCEIDLDGARAALPRFLSADWIHGRAQIEPEIHEKVREGLIGLQPETGIILRLSREEVVLSQQSRIFLSHKRVNKAMVQRFYDVLNTLGFEPWLDDEDMVAGENLHRGMQAGMHSSCAAVFFITPEFLDEKYLRHEIDLAMREKTERGDRFSIITLSLANERGERGNVPDILRAYIFKEPATELEALREILRALPVRVGKVEWPSTRTP